MVDVKEVNGKVINRTYKSFQFKYKKNPLIEEKIKDIEQAIDAMNAVVARQLQIVTITSKLLKEDTQTSHADGGTGAMIAGTINLIHANLKYNEEVKKLKELKKQRDLLIKMR